MKNHASKTVSAKALARKKTASVSTSAGPAPSPQVGPPAGNGVFAYTREQFQALAHQAVQHAKRLGASDAAVEVSEGCGLTVNVRMGELETVERNRDKSLGISVLLGQRRGNASTCDFSEAAVIRAVQAAYDIARYTAEDPHAGLADAVDIAAPGTHLDLDLFHPWLIDSEAAAELALQCEQAALATDKRITNSEGASVSAQHSHFYAVHTNGFEGGYASSRHSLSVAPIAGKGAQMQRDYWYSSMRDAQRLASAQAVGRYAAERALARLGSRSISTRQCPVLFESTLAVGLMGAFAQAISGGALYRQSSFLPDALGQQVFAEHVEIEENPFILAGKGSAPFDAEGVRVQPRKLVRDGRVQGYLLSSYTARKLGMRTTGNAGGSHNLTMSSKHTQAGDDLRQMLRKLGTGLFVIELMGQGVNGVTGDYSRGASGFWVEGGEIAFPVQEVTIAGNLKDMFKGIVAIGADAYNYGAKTSGSVLIERMTVAGA